MLNPKAKKDGASTTAQESFGAVTVEANGWSLSIDAQGNATLSGTGNATVITKGNVLSGDTPKSPAILKEKLADQTPNIGSMVDGKGIYQGVFILPERHGITLPPLHLWMAPKDLGHYDGITKNDTLTNCFQRSGELNIFDGRHTLKHNHDNTPVGYEKAVYEYLRDRAENEDGENSLWFVPTKEMFDGRKLDEQIKFNSDSKTIFGNKDRLPKGSEMHAYHYTFDPLDPTRALAYTSCTPIASDADAPNHEVIRFYGYKTRWSSNHPALKQTQKCAMRLVAADFKI